MSGFCKNCGAQLNDDSLFCNKCGTKIEATVVQNTNEIMPTSIAENSVETTKKGKSKKKVIIATVVSVVLIICVVIGIVFIHSMLTPAGAPKVVYVDDETAYFDISFEQFRDGLVKNVEPVYKIMGGVLPNVTEDYIDALIDEDNWDSWEGQKDTMIYMWEYSPSGDSFTHDMIVTVDMNTNKIKVIASKSYYPDIFTKTLVTSYIMYGNNLTDENLEVIGNMAGFCLGIYSDSLPICMDDRYILAYTEDDGYEPIYIFGPVTEDLKEDDGSTIYIDNEELYRFDKVLSSRYGFDYDWVDLDKMMNANR